MKILVCISNVPDTTTKIKFVNNNSSLDKTGVQWIINPWDELILTRALEIKENPSAGIESISVITVGLADSEPTIRKALAIGADGGIRINAVPTDSYFVAAQIAEIINKENFDIIMCGIESSDFNGASVGGMIAEFLNLTSVSSVSFLDIAEGKINMKREIDGGYETVSTPSPFVVIAQKGIAKEPRIPSMRGIMSARTKPLQVVEPIAADTLIDYIDYELPKPKSACKKVDPENVKELINLLHTEAKVI